jgi:acyl-CoA synthetase (AMP-forming)/AMP-acid ligase II
MKRHSCVPIFSETIKSHRDVTPADNISGTTGFPKAVRGRLGRSYQFAVGGKFHEMGIRPQPNGDRWYIAMPICHATAGSTSLASIVRGATLCIA